MERKISIKCTEEEILDKIQEGFPGIQYDSIVAYEEIGNQHYVVEVSPGNDTEEEFEAEIKSGLMYALRPLLEALCRKEILEEGTYIIDCTW